MTVLYLIDSLEGYGAEKSIAHLASNFKDVTPVFVHLYRGEQLKSSLEAQRIKVHSLDIPARSGFDEAVKRIVPIILEEKPDIIHSTLFRADMVARKLKRKFPDILLVGSLVSNSYGKRRYSQLSLLSRLKLFSTQLRDRYTAGEVDYYICNSRAIKYSNMKALRIPEERIKIIHRGRSFYNHCPASSAAHTLKEELNIEDRKVFLNVGRLCKGKGQLDLLYSFKNLIQRRTDTVLMIAGEGPLKNQLIHTIEELDLEEFVLLLGYREDVKDLLCIADYFVFPTYYEGLPGALIEAIIAKTPVIVSSIEENKECLPKNGGLFFRPGNIEELSMKLEQSLDLNDWEQRTASAYENAFNKFNISTICREYENFYKSILTK